MSAKKIPLDVVRLAGGYKASREGKDRSIATQEILDSLPAMGFEIDISSRPPADATELTFTGKAFDDEKTQPPGTPIPSAKP